MSDEDDSVTNLYGKEIQTTLDIEFIDLNHTGSYDDRENQVVVLTVSEDLLSPIRKSYRKEDPRGIKDFEKVRNDDGTISLYFGGSYGAKSLLGSVGRVLYYTDEF